MEEASSSSSSISNTLKISVSAHSKVWSKEEKDAAMQLLVQECGDTIESLPVKTEHIIFNEHVHLLDCLLENILIVVAADDVDAADDADPWTIVESDESALNSRKTRIKGLTMFDLLLRIRCVEKFIEPLLYIGLDATPYSRQILAMINHPARLCKPSQSVVNAVYRSRILCLFKIMYHKFIFLSFDGIFQLVQTLLVEYLYDDKYKGAKRLGSGNYEGDIVDDGNMTVTGRGICRFDSGDRYEGDYVNGIMTGSGIYRWANGGSYEGDWVDGKRTGKGVHRLSDGSIYEGDWVDGKMTGKGVIRSADGDSYEGDFVNHKMTGRGVFRWPNGDMYDGNFLDDKMATGQMFLADVNLNLAAEFSGGEDAAVDGYKLYRLVLKNPDGSVYREGDFSHGKFV